MRHVLGHRSDRRLRVVAYLLSVAVVGSACSSSSSGTDSTDGTTSSSSASAAIAALAPTDIVLSIDAALAPAGQSDWSAVGFADGNVETFVANQLLVVAPDRTALDALLGRWPLSVMEEIVEDDGSISAQLSINADIEVDSAALASTLDQLQPWLAGDIRASDPRALAIYTIAAAEEQLAEVTLVPNDILASSGNGEGQFAAIQEGRSLEQSTDGAEAEVQALGSDPFKWPYLADGTVQDFGVVGAWTILEGTNNFKRSAFIGIHDGGFMGYFDYGPNADIYHGDWGDPNEMGCGPGNKCPWHGTNVAQTALAHLDDGVGVAGTAGPVGLLRAIVAPNPSSWDNMRDLRNVALDQGLHVVNMSWGNKASTFLGIRELYYDGFFKRIHDSNTLLVASAGNDGENVDAFDCGDGCVETHLSLPCESQYVLCVGGVAWDSVNRHEGSNFGTTDDNRSVEIYGPYEVVATSVDDSGDFPKPGPLKKIGGTSFSSPFVAGIAALLFSADFSMTPSKAMSILKSTSRTVVSDVDMRSGSRRLVNAREAVAELLGITLVPPTITFDTPLDGEVLDADGLVAVRPRAVDMFGNELWTHVITGAQDLGFVIPGGHVVPTLGPGEHTIVAGATDRLGMQATPATVRVIVPDNPATLQIVGVSEGVTVDGGSELDLIGRGRDGDTFQAIPTKGLAWALLGPGGDILAIDEGELFSFELPNVAGNYQVVLDSNDVVADEVVVSFKVRKTDPSWTPVIAIDEPRTADWYSVNSLGDVEISFAGRATVKSGNSFVPVLGERMRWVATASNGERVVMCQGTSFTAKPGDIVSSITRCDSGTATLYLVPTDGSNTWWNISLEVINPATGAVASKQVTIYLEYIAS